MFTLVIQPLRFWGTINALIYPKLVWDGLFFSSGGPNGEYSNNLRFQTFGNKETKFGEG